MTTRRSVGARRLLASLLGAFAVYVALVGLMPDALPRRELYADLAYLPFSIITGVLFWQASRTGTDRCRQRGLQLLVAAQLFGTVNQAVWVLGSAGLLTDDSPVFMIAGLAMTVSTAAGMLYLVPGRGVAGTTPVVPVIDATLLALASFSVGWQWVGAPVLLAGTESGGGFLWLASVAGGDLFTALIALTAWAFTGQRLRSSAAAFLALGLGLTALLDILLEYQTLRGTYQSGGAVDVAFATSIVLLGVAAFIEQAPGEESTERSVRRAMLMRVLLPLVSAVAILLPVIAQVISPTPGWARFVPVVLLGVFFFFVQWRARVLERAAEQALITRLAIERDLRLSQQFESLGRYAASVAHDMSNLLAALLAQTHVLRLVAGPVQG
ncbi:MAG: hypothetical protein P3B98_12255, partial [Gemmatimonadota bacterium]|nr:hypothetical protein [Gemmatimonadota bacterium]